MINKNCFSPTLSFLLTGTLIIIFLFSAAPLQIRAQPACDPSFISGSGSFAGYPGDTSITLDQVSVYVGSDWECPPRIELGKPQITFIGSGPASGSINLLKPPAQHFETYQYPETTTFDLMMELTPDLSPGIYKFRVTVNSSCIDECVSPGYSLPGSDTSGTFTLTVFPDQTLPCCQPTIHDQTVSAVDPGSSLPVATVEIENLCPYYEGGAADVRSNLTLNYQTTPHPESGSMSFSLNPTIVNVPHGGSSSVEVIGNFSSDLAPGFYQVDLTVTASCSDQLYGTASYTDNRTFTIYVQPTVEDECCLPTLGTQLNTTAAPGERVPLASINISNTCFERGEDFSSQPRVTIEEIRIFPHPISGRIFMLPVPQTIKVAAGSFQRVTLFAVLTAEVPRDFYQIDLSLSVECETPRQIVQKHRIQESFTLSVEEQSDQIFTGGLEIPQSFTEGMCAAPGSTVLIPINTIREPEKFKWEGVVDFANGQKQSRLVAASHRAIVTVVPPGLEGKTNVRVRGEGGQTNTVVLNLDPSCISNQGKEVTEEQLRQWAQQVPDDLEERATDQTGQYLSFVPGEIIVQFQGPPQELEQLKEKYGILSLEKIPPTNFYVARLENRGIRKTLESADDLSAEQGVLYASENSLMTLVQKELNDPYLHEQTHLLESNMFTGWSTFFPLQGQGVTIAVVDTGSDLTVKHEIRTPPSVPNGIDVSGGHQDLATLLGTSTAEDRRGHGTIVASIAAAQGDNEELGAGVAFNSRVIPIKVFGQSRFASEDTIAKGLVAAFYLQSDVVNMSLGCSRCRPSKERQMREYFDRVITSLYEDFRSQGLIPPIMVAATGNDAEGIVDTPAADPRVIAIGSYNLEKEQRSSFSNYGKEVDFVAPGENIQTTLLGGEFGDAGDGTSFSSPQGAGLVALILSTQPNLKELGVEAVREKIKDCFLKEVGEPGFDHDTGWGMLYIPEPEEVDPSRCLIFE